MLMSWQKVFHLEGDLERLGALKMNRYRRRKIRKAGWGVLSGIIVALIVVGIILVWIVSQESAGGQGSGKAGEK